MNEGRGISKIFSSYLYVNRLHNNESILVQDNKDLKEELYKFYSKDVKEKDNDPDVEIKFNNSFGYSSLHPVGHHKTNDSLHEQESKSVTKLFSNITYHLENFLVEAGIDTQHQDFVIGKSWFNIQSPNTQVPPHDHHGAVVSGAYYVDVPEKDESPFILERFPQGQFDELWKRTEEGDIDNPHSSQLPFLAIDHIGFIPKNGDILMWPSHLVHKVSGTTPNVRVVISFDVYAYSELNASFPGIIIRNHYHDDYKEGPTR